MPPTRRPLAPDKLSAARAQIAAKNWPDAIEELKRVNDTGSADWNNLMGYSLRKGATPDFAGAEKFYNEALRIDPKHRGALEYSGELYLQTGDLATRRAAPGRARQGVHLRLRGIQRPEEGDRAIQGCWQQVRRSTAVVITPPGRGRRARSTPPSGGYMHVTVTVWS